MSRDKNILLSGVSRIFFWASLFFSGFLGLSEPPPPLLLSAAVLSLSPEEELFGFVFDSETVALPSDDVLLLLMTVPSVGGRGSPLFPLPVTKFAFPLPPPTPASATVTRLMTPAGTSLRRSKRSNINAFPPGEERNRVWRIILFFKRDVDTFCELFFTTSWSGPPLPPPFHEEEESDICNWET